MVLRTARAVAHPNIALIKYWGNRQDDLRLPSNDSLSLTLAGLHTWTTVEVDDELHEDQVLLNGELLAGPPAQRVTEHLDRVRILGKVSHKARVISHNDFPAGAGMASSASAFAALTLAACSAYQVQQSTRQASRLARQASGSASRSLEGGYVLLHSADDDQGAYAEQVFPPDYWRLLDVLAVVDLQHKSIGSTRGHQLAQSSPLQAARVADTPRRLMGCMQAIRRRDFGDLAAIIEQDSQMMHAIMMTSQPPLFYWRPATAAILLAVQQWRLEGLRVCCTLDAGPNPHCLCEADDAPQVRAQLEKIPAVQHILLAEPGGPARLEHPESSAPG
jgi:diphosphomevalonate decarboxylase